MSRYKVEFYLDVDDADSQLVEEAVADLVDQEIRLHRDGERRCGVKFIDALTFQASHCEEKD